jgi:hypothetical protein
MVIALADLVPKSFRKGVSGDEPEHARERLFGVPEIVLLLSIKPEVRCRAREPSQTCRHLGTHRRRAGENAVESLTRNAKLSGSLADGEAEAWQNSIAQQPARMGRGRDDVSGRGHAVTFGEAHCSVMGDR